MENVATVIFEVESEAYQAFTELRANPQGAGYSVAEAALVKREGDSLAVADAFDAAGITTDDAAMGLMIGSVVGLLGGPLGVLLGAGLGALTGGVIDHADAADSMSMLETTALKLYENEVAIIALVQEDEPSFDAAFDKYEVTITRHTATDVYDEVEYAREVQDGLAKQAKELMRAEKKEARAERREERKAAIKARFEEIKAKHA